MWQTCLIWNKRALVNHYDSMIWSPLWHTSYWESLCGRSSRPTRCIVGCRPRRCSRARLQTAGTWWRIIFLSPALCYCVDDMIVLRMLHTSDAGCASARHFVIVPYCSGPVSVSSVHSNFNKNRSISLWFLKATENEVHQSVQVDSCRYLYY